MQISFVPGAIRQSLLTEILKHQFIINTMDFNIVVIAEIIGAINIINFTGETNEINNY